MVPYLRTPSLKNDFTLLQKLIESLIEKDLISKEEINDFINDIYLVGPKSYIKESYISTSLTIMKRSARNSGKHKNSVIKYKKKVSFDPAQLSFYSNFSEVYCGEVNSFVEKNQDNTKELNKFEEISFHNSSSLKNVRKEKSLEKKKFHESFG